MPALLGRYGSIVLYPPLARRLGFAVAYPWQMPISSSAPAAQTLRLRDAPEIAVHLVEAGLACCGLEIGSALTRGLLEPGESPVLGADKGNASVLVISGTVTSALLPALERMWADLPFPKAAIAFGACATAGGPYWDAPNVLPGAGEALPISVVVAGCPPRPEALVTAIRAAAKAAQ